jgi:hypothetical protein
MPQCAAVAGGYHSLVAPRGLTAQVFTDETVTAADANLRSPDGRTALLRLSQRVLARGSSV